jgi:hypothetical protein
VRAGNNPQPFQGQPPTVNRGLDTRRGYLGAGGVQQGGSTVFGGGRGTLNGGPTPLTLPSPLVGTTPSPSLDMHRGSRGMAPQGTRPYTSYPAWRSNNGSQPLATGATGATSNAAALAALRARAAGANAQAPRLVGPGGAGQPAAVHQGGVRRGGPAVGPAASLPTHTGGVRVEPQRWRSFHRNGRQVWTPDWGYAPYQPVTYVEYVNVFGFCPQPYFQPEPWPMPAPVYLEPEYYLEAEYVYPALPLPALEAPALVAPPAPTAWPAPSAPTVAPEPDAAPAEPGAEAQASRSGARADAFGKGFEAFQRAAYADALGRFEALVKVDAKDGEAWMAIAHAAFALGIYPRSAEALAQVAALGGFPRGYRFDPAPLYTGEGTFDGLLKGVMKHVAALPRDADARLVLAWLFTSLGRRIEAQEQIQQILMLRPDDTTAPVLSIALLPAPPQPAEGAANAPAPVPVPAR